MSRDWKSSLSTVERLGIIQNLQASLPKEKRNEAIAIEQSAYQNSTTRDEYVAAVSATSPASPLLDAPPNPSAGTRIGRYLRCHPVAQGVTSEVYRCDNRALKVIVAHRNIEPHNPQREAAILSELSALRPPPEHIVSLVETFRDQEQRLVLAFPYLPLTLDALLAGSTKSLPSSQVVPIFANLVNALASIHKQGIIHRDIKPSAVLLQSSCGPAYLSDFGSAWHPRLSSYTERPANKILDIGTGPYRAPEVLFASKAYDTSVDMWALGVMLAEAISSPPEAPFESRPAHEDGNQLGLILSIFKTLGTPTEEMWPEAKQFKVSPFELWAVFPPKSWEEVLPNADADMRCLVADLVCYESSNRLTAAQVCHDHVVSRTSH